MCPPVSRILAPPPPWYDCPKENSTSKPSLLVTVPLAQSPTGAEVYSSSACRECHQYVLSDLFLSGGGKKSAKPIILPTSDRDSTRH